MHNIILNIIDRVIRRELIYKFIEGIAESYSYLIKFFKNVRAINSFPIHRVFCLFIKIIPSLKKNLWKTILQKC